MPEIAVPAITDGLSALVDNVPSVCTKYVCPIVRELSADITTAVPYSELPTSPKAATVLLLDES